MKYKRIYNYWQERAEEHKSLFDISSNDTVLGRLEIECLRKYLPINCKVLEIGCSAGRVIKELIKTHPNFYYGIDFSEKMINKASLLNLPNCKFDVQDILNYKKDNFFDVVYSVRCIINLLDLQDHLEMIKIIASWLKNDGRVILLEATKQGLDKINEFRKIAGLEEIVHHDFNKYIDLTSFLPEFEKYFNFEIIEFASSYYLASRLFNAFAAKLESRPMQYEDPINLLGAKLPVFGDFAAHKLIVGTKKS